MHHRTWILLSTLALALPLAACGDDTGGGGGNGGSGSGGASASSGDAPSSSGNASTGNSSGSSGGGASSSNASSSASTADVSASSSTGDAVSSSSGGVDPVEVIEPCTDDLTPDAEVTNESFTAFSPSAVTIPVGGIVRFAPTGPHDMTADDSSWATTTSAEACIRFNEVGGYPFHCSVHPAMTGTITVE